MPEINNLKNLNNPHRQFALTCVFVILIYTVFLYLSGYFEIGLMSDDYLNLISAVNSNVTEKFTSGIRDYSIYHFRPLWFLTMELSTYLNGLMNFEYDNFVFFRTVNLIFFLLLAFLVSEFIFRITRSYLYSVLPFLLMLAYPNNNISIFWTTGMVDLLCGLFLILALLMTNKYLNEKNAFGFILSQIFFILALLTKETALMLPPVTFLIFKLISEKKDDRLKLLLKSELLILIMYVAYRIILLKDNLPDVFTIYGNPGMINYLLIIIKAIISLVIPFDYLTLRNGISESDVFIVLNVLLSVIFGIYILFKLLKAKNYGSLFTVSLIFLIILIPNLIAGYFRSQLIIIPYMLICISVFIILSKYEIKFSKIYSAVIILFFCLINYNNIQDWKYGYGILKESISQLVKADFSNDEMNYIIGLPSRYNSVYLDDYATGPYNYFKYKKFIINDRNIVDFVHTGALDKNSLNSELMNKLNSDGLMEINVSGKTQYLLKLDIVSDVFNDENSELKFSDYNSFGKPLKANIKILKDSSKIFLFSGGILRKPENKQSQ